MKLSYLVRLLLGSVVGEDVWTVDTYVAEDGGEVVEGSRQPIASTGSREYNIFRMALQCTSDAEFVGVVHGHCPAAVVVMQYRP